MSHYQLTLEPGTVFAAQPPALPDDDAAASMLNACAERLGTAGFVQYEVSAYAPRRTACRHNLNYWMFGDYLGIGAGAHGKCSQPDARCVRTRSRASRAATWPTRNCTHRTAAPAGSCLSSSC